MSLLEKIQMLMDEKGLNNSTLAKGADIPYTTVDGLFKKEVENAHVSTLTKIAVYFDVSIEFLINDKINDRNYGKIIQTELSNEEYRILSLWRKLPREQQLKLIGRIEALAEEVIPESDNLNG